MTRSLLLTCFGPFGKEKVNPSGRAVKQLDGRSIHGVRIVGLELPVVFGEAAETLRGGIERVKPVALISSGVAPGRSEICLERVAINVMDTRYGDNAGNKPRDEPIIKRGPAAYFSTLPIRAIVRDLIKAGIPAVVSNTAGTHLCNYSMYVGLHHVTTKGLKIPSGFVHVPQTPDQAVNRRMASMSFEISVKALEIAVRRTLLSIS